MVTSRDATLVSILVEAQSGPLRTRVAGPCPLRGGQRATVIDSGEAAARLSAAVGLLGASAALADKAADHDLPLAVRPAAALSGRRLAGHGRRVAALVGLDPTAILDAPAGAARAERSGTSLDDFLAPTGAAVGAVFAETAVLAGRPGNVARLRRAGDAFGRLEHLLDAVEDRSEDRANGVFNPLEMVAADDAEAMVAARALVAEVRAGLVGVQWTDATLVDALFAGELDRAVQRAFRPRRRGAAGAARSVAIAGAASAARSVAIAGAASLAAVVTLASITGPPPDEPPPFDHPHDEPSPPEFPGESVAPPPLAGHPLPPPPLATDSGGEDIATAQTKRGCVPRFGSCCDCSDCCDSCGECTSGCDC